MPSGDIHHLGGGLVVLLRGFHQLDLQFELAAHPALKEAIAHCEKVGDYISRELFEEILESEEEHIDFLETQLELMGKVGMQNWLQSQMGEGGAS